MFESKALKGDELSKQAVQHSLHQLRRRGRVGLKRQDLPLPLVARRAEQTSEGMGDAIKMCERMLFWQQIEHKKRTACVTHVFVKHQRVHNLVECKHLITVADLAEPRMRSKRVCVGICMHTCMCESSATLKCVHASARAA